jgi:hypothetical protein
MTSVYSGGLVYEYSEEGSKYGLVTIQSTSAVVEGSDFASLQTAFKGTANPTGDGGYNSTGGASTCPSYSSNWNVTSNSLPAIPSGAAALFKTGAGKGPGLTGAGSQNAGGTSTGTATAGSGVVASATSTNSKSAASSSRQGPIDRAPIIVGAIVVSFTFLGATLL